MSNVDDAAPCRESMPGSAFGCTLALGHEGDHEWNIDPAPLAAQNATRREFAVWLEPEQAVTLYVLVAKSDAFNGLGNLYAQLGEFVRDEHGHVPSHVDYAGPTWA